MCSPSIIFGPSRSSSAKFLIVKNMEVEESVTIHEQILKNVPLLTCTVNLHYVLKEKINSLTESRT